MTENFDIQLLTNRISELCVRNNVSINKMLSECRLNKSIMDNLKKGSVPSVDKILTISRYFSVSTDYLLGNVSRSDANMSKNLSKEEILSLAKKKGIKISFLNDLIGGYRGKLTDWKNGKTTLTDSEKNIISNYVLGNTSNSENNIENLDFSLSEEDLLHIKKYHELDNYSKRVVDNILDIEYERYLNEKSDKKITTKIAAFGGDNKEIEVSEDNLRKAVSLLEEDDD